MVASGAKEEPGLLTALRIASAFSLGRLGRLWLLAGDGRAPSEERARAGYLRMGGAGHKDKVRHRAVPRKLARGAAGRAR